MQEKLRERIEPSECIDRYIFDWHNFPLDYWWRVKYRIPFGSQQHRNMNFIDMLIEYREEIVVKRFQKEYKERQEFLYNKELGLETDNKVLKMSKQEIDDEYENLDLSQFNN